jgi:hypothetical protein
MKANADPKMQNRPAFRTEIRVRGAQTVAAFPCKLQTGQLPDIEIP